MFFILTSVALLVISCETNVTPLISIPIFLAVNMLYDKVAEISKNF